MRMACDKFGDEDLAVADLAGACRIGDGLDDLLENVIVNGQLNFRFGQEVDDVLGASIQLGVAALPAEAL